MKASTGCFSNYSARSDSSKTELNNFLKYSWGIFVLIKSRPYIILIKVVFPQLDNDLWSRRSLKKIITYLEKSIGVQKLGRPHNRPSTLVGVLISSVFQFPETISVIAINRRGEMREKSIRVKYPCKPLYCYSCGGFGYINCKERT